MDSGYIPLSRKIFQHKLWTAKRVFSKFEAWIDLLQLVSFDEKPKSMLINNQVIKYGRGQFPASIRFLMERWNWGSINKVNFFLKLLKNEDMICISNETGQNVITICNYDTYNPTQKKLRQQRDSNETAMRQQRDKTNKDNKEINKSIVLPFSSAEFLNAWNDWKTYKKAEHRFAYKSEISENAALKELAEIANQQEETAIKIINYSIAKSYKGLFPIPNNKNNNTEQNQVREAAPQMTQAEVYNLFSPLPKVNGVHQ